MAFLWVMTLIGAIAGGFLLAAAFVVPKGAPQEAALAAMAVALAVIPYVFTRAIEGLSTGAWQQKLIDAVDRASAQARVSPSLAPTVATTGRSLTAQDLLDSIRAGGCSIKDYNGGWEIISPGGTKHYAYTIDDLRRRADQFGAAPARA